MRDGRSVFAGQLRNGEVDRALREIRGIVTSGGALLLAVHLGEGTVDDSSSKARPYELRSSPEQRQDGRRANVERRREKSVRGWRSQVVIGKIAERILCDLDLRAT